VRARREHPVGEDPHAVVAGVHDAHGLHVAEGLLLRRCLAAHSGDQTVPVAVALVAGIPAMIVFALPTLLVASIVVGAFVVQNLGQLAVRLL
jgi:hypothetical protein